jgi:hypothetical protein
MATETDYSDPESILDAAYDELVEKYPDLDWDGRIGDAVSEALEAAFAEGRHFGNSYPD